MLYRSKRYRQAVSLYNPYEIYPLESAIRILKSLPSARFDETVDGVFHLGVDPTKGEEQVRGYAVLPYPIWKDVKVLVFAQGPHQKEAEQAGADYVGLDEYIQKIEKEKWLGFDHVIATPMVMGKVGRIAKILGPRNLMPNPKYGTVTLEVGKAVKEGKNGKVLYRVDKFGNVHVPFGKKSFSEKELMENFETLIDSIIRAKPPTSKGVYLRGIYISTTMGPSFKVDPLPYR
jgi:large subunit ribosomal protein L1